MSPTSPPAGRSGSEKGTTMTEVEWLACNDSASMLTFLGTKRVCGRKGQLFVCSAARYYWTKLVDRRSQKAVEVSELFADDLATEQELREAQAEAGDAADSLAEFCVQGSPPSAEELWNAAELAWEVASLYPNYLTKSFPNCIACLRDIFGNPFRPVALDPAWFRWNDGAIPRIAQAIYDERRFADLPILADALEEAGCTSADILEHCRAEGEHVRGCWVVDLMLGKE